jgi:hypothetical protein
MRLWKPVEKKDWLTEAVYTDEDPGFSCIDLGVGERLHRSSLTEQRMSRVQVQKDCRQNSIA